MIFSKDFYSIENATILLNKFFNTDVFTQQDIIDFYLLDYFDFCIRAKSISENEIDLFSFKGEINAKTVNAFDEPVDNAILSIVGNDENYLDVIQHSINGNGYFSIPKEAVEIGKDIKIYGLRVLADSSLNVEVIDELIPENHSNFRAENLTISIEKGVVLPIGQILISKSGLLNAIFIIKEQNANMLNNIKSLESTEKELSPKSETAYLNLIGALLEVILDSDKKFKNQSELIDYLAHHYDGYSGLAERTLKGKFAEAKRAFQAYR